MAIALMMGAGGAAAETAQEAESAVRALVARWYEEAAKGRDGRWTVLTAPGVILDWPHRCECGEQPAMLLPGPPFELAAIALKFAYEIRQITINADLAKAKVWERGWFYAAAGHGTYQRAVDTLFILERQSDGRWLVLAHRPNSTAIHPEHENDPMPDLKPVWEELMNKKAAE